MIRFPGMTARRKDITNEQDETSLQGIVHKMRGAA